MNKWQVGAVVSAVVACVSVGGLCWTASPITYGAGELTGGGQVGVGVGMLTAIGSAISFVVSLFKVGSGGKLIADAAELLGPIVKGESNVSQSAVRVALFTLQLDRSQQGDSEGLELVSVLTARILIKKEATK